MSVWATKRYQIRFLIAGPLRRGGRVRASCLNTNQANTFPPRTPGADVYDADGPNLTHAEMPPRTRSGQLLDRSRSKRAAVGKGGSVAVGGNPPCLQAVPKQQIVRSPHRLTTAVRLSRDRRRAWLAHSAGSNSPQEQANASSCTQSSWASGDWQARQSAERTQLGNPGSHLRPRGLVWEHLIPMGTRYPSWCRAAPPSRRCYPSSNCSQRR
jgi:hypothetical protein